jgi:hypothetical protein
MTSPIDVLLKEPLRKADRLHSLAAGVMVDFDPADTVRAAGEAGWPACGIWYDHDSWSDARTVSVRRALDDCDVIALDIEPIIVSSGDDHGERIVELGATLGARFILFTSRIDDWSIVIERFGRLCDLARQANMTVVCEFLPIFPLATLADALNIVTAANRVNGAVLVDNLHLRTSGATPNDCGALDRSLFPYIQIADAPLVAPTSFNERLNEAINERQWPGSGQLPINELLDVLPSVPISYEVRSQRDREAFPQPLARAQHAFDSVVTWHLNRQQAT